MINPENPLLYTLPFDGKRVIEIGSGAGGFTLLHLTRAGEVVCVEKDPDANQLLAEDWQAEGHPAWLTFTPRSVEELDTAEIGQFDFAVFSNSF
jgi:16S rRNA A1518/A1519 N6-dimethyltransferase RsmA/KsgA/DIM1 with predicted DNA glycosylase/AP lyase activity